MTWSFAVRRSNRSLFPQHGPGKKHERPTELEPWQCGLVVRLCRRADVAQLTVHVGVKS
jgi:hypothetical protein